jgi:hypothetical protein
MAGVTGCADPKHRIDRNLMPSGRKPFFLCADGREMTREPKLNTIFRSLFYIKKP